MGLQDDIQSKYFQIFVLHATQSLEFSFIQDLEIEVKMNLSLDIIRHNLQAEVLFRPWEFSYVPSFCTDIILHRSVLLTLLMPRSLQEFHKLQPSTPQKEDSLKVGWNQFEAKKIMTIREGLQKYRIFHIIRRAPHLKIWDIFFLYILYMGQTTVLLQGQIFWYFFFDWFPPQWS